MKILKFLGIHPISYITNKVHTFSCRVKLESSNMECSKVLIVPTVNAIKALHAVGNIKLTSFRLESPIRSWKEWSWKYHQFTNFSMLPALISNFMWEKSWWNLLNCSRKIYIQVQRSRKCNSYFNVPVSYKSLSWVVIDPRTVESPPRYPTEWQIR